MIFLAAWPFPSRSLIPDWMSREKASAVSIQRKEHSPLNSFGPEYGTELFKIRRLSCVRFPFKKHRNREKETERPAQDQQYEQVPIRLRGNRKRRPVGNEKAKKTIRESGDAG
jgi:hypothetical protein